jgi:hypothetical protein
MSNFHDFCYDAYRLDDQSGPLVRPYRKGGAVMPALLVIMAVTVPSPGSIPEQPQPISQNQVVMRETMQSGMTLEIKTNVSLTGNMGGLDKNGQKVTETAIKATGSTHYRERVLEFGKGNEPVVAVRLCRTATLEKRIDSQAQRIVLRPAVGRVVVRHENNHNTVFSPDGPLMVSELDMLRSDPFTPMLRGLLPSGAVKQGDQWPASAEATSELTGVNPIQSGGLACTLSEVKSTADGAVARVRMAGSFNGPTDQGPTRMNIEGHFIFDLDARLITRLVLDGTSEILSGEGNVIGKLQGRYELDRRPAIDDPKLTDTGLAGVELKPTPGSTSLLYESVDLGVRFRYPRNWEITSAKKNLIQLDEETGGRMHVTIDPSPPATSAKLRSELLTWLESQKAAVKVASSPEKIALTSTLAAERFSIRATLGQKPKEWNYLVVRANDRAATLAVNLLEERADVLRGDINSVAQSIEFLPRGQPKK